MCQHGECGRLANVVSGLEASHAAMLKDKDELHLARCVPKAFQLETPMEPQKVLESMSGCATRFIGIVDVDTCHSKNDESRGPNGKLPDVCDDVSKESGKTSPRMKVTNVSSSGRGLLVPLLPSFSGRIKYIASRLDWTGVVVLPTFYTVRYMQASTTSVRIRQYNLCYCCQGCLNSMR